MKYSIENIERIVVFTIKNKNVDSQISPKLKAELLIICQPDIEALVVDLSNVDSIDSSGIGSFLLAERQLSDYGVPMLFVGVNQNILSTLKMLNLDVLFDFYDKVDDALADIEASR
jgi:anti-anti-sigma factor